MDMNDAISRIGKGPGPSKEPMMNDNPDSSWSRLNDANPGTSSSGSSSSIRWDHIQPFPSGVPANKMWEAFNRYIENFEIATSLNNVNDPVQRTRFLFLVMGNELQEIVKAAKLRPNLTNTDCYKTFVSNITSYFRSMTDTAAEHEAFLRMRQEKGESAVAFHARLMCKVRSCNYSVDDEDRFVRAQLLKGLRNRDMVKHARTYAYDTNFIVQSATRDEAFEAETHQGDDPNHIEVRRVQQSSSTDRRKRSIAPSRADDPPARQYRRNEADQQIQGRRQKCTRCALLSHRNRTCPALNRNCNSCGKRGHFAAACRQKQVNYMQNVRSDDRASFSNEDKHEDKQVLND